MKQLIILLLLTLNIETRSQDTVKIPTPIARQIVRDLTVCDSVKVEHESTKQLLFLAEKRSIIQDTIIGEYKKKTHDYRTQIMVEEQKTYTWQNQYKGLAVRNKKLKTNLTVTRITLIGIIGFLGYLYITK